MQDAVVACFKHTGVHANAAGQAPHQKPTDIARHAIHEHATLILTQKLQHTPRTYFEKGTRFCTRALPYTHTFLHAQTHTHTHTH
jgi:hypothetical protein